MQSKNMRYDGLEFHPFTKIGNLIQVTLYNKK